MRAKSRFLIKKQILYERYVLPFGSSKDVREEVKRRISDLGPGGGFVFCAVHNIQADVPPENVVTMYEAALEFGRYA